MMAKRVALSTKDNPFNPITQFDEWMRYDEERSYFSAAYVARIAHVSEELSDAELLEEEERAIDEIVNLNILGIYIKVVEES